MTPGGARFSKTNPPPRSVGSTTSLTWPYWPRPGRPLPDELVLALDAARDGLAVGDLRVADVRLDLELAAQAVDDDLEVELAHARR